MKILGIDPGNVTGIAYWQHDRITDTWEIPGEMKGLTSWAHMFWANTIRPMPDLIVVEDFIINEKTHKLTRQPTAYEGIGVVYLLGEFLGVPVEKVHAGGHKPFSGVKKPMAQSKIIRLGWCKRTKDRHAEDACSLVLWGLRHHDRETFAALMRQIASA